MTRRCSCEDDSGSSWIPQELACRSCCLQSLLGPLCTRAPHSSLCNEDCLPRTAGEAEPTCARDCGPRGRKALGDTTWTLSTPRLSLSRRVRRVFRRPSGFPGSRSRVSPGGLGFLVCLDLLCRGSQLAKHSCAESGHCVRSHCFHAASLGAPTPPAPSPPPPGRGAC